MKLGCFILFILVPGQHCKRSIFKKEVLSKGAAPVLGHVKLEHKLQGPVKDLIRTLSCPYKVLIGSLEGPYKVLMRSS